MKKVLFLIAIFAGIGLLILIGYFLSRDTNTAEHAVPGREIVYHDHGFSPPAMRVASGSTITIKNESSRQLQFSSDAYPDNTLNPELNTNALQPGESLELIVANRGTWGYHDNLNPNQRGLLVVE